jgi:hypothetical protein
MRFSHCHWNGSNDVFSDDIHNNDNDNNDTGKNNANNDNRKNINVINTTNITSANNTINQSLNVQKYIYNHILRFRDARLGLLLRAAYQVGDFDLVRGLVKSIKNQDLKFDDSNNSVDVENINSTTAAVANGTITTNSNSNNNNNSNNNKTKENECSNIPQFIWISDVVRICAEYGDIDRVERVINFVTAFKNVSREIDCIEQYAMRATLTSSG